MTRNSPLHTEAWRKRCEHERWKSQNWRAIKAVEEARAADARRRQKDRLLRSSVEAERVKGLEMHVLDLLNEHRISATWCESVRDAWAWIRRRRVQIPVVRSELAAACCLHEIAHLLAGFCWKCQNLGATNRGCLSCENHAWNYAIRKLSPPTGFTRGMHAAVKIGLSSYQVGAPHGSPYSFADELKSDLHRCRDVQARTRMEGLVLRQKAVMAEIKAQGSVR